MLFQPLYKRSFIFAITFTFLLGILSCAGRQLKTTEEKIPLESAALTLEQLHQEQTIYQSLSGYAQVEVEAKGRKKTFDAAIIIEAPNRLLLQILDDLGQERFKLVADGRNVFWQDRDSDENSILPQNDHSLEKALRLPLSVEDFIARLLWQVPPGTIQEAFTEAKRPLPLLKVRLDQNLLEIQQNPPRLLKFFSLSGKRKEKIKYRVAYKNFQSAEGKNFPHSFHWAFRKPKAEVSIDFQTIQLNPSFPVGRFDIPLFNGSGE